MTSALADPVTTEVIRNFMSACAEDMNAALFRSAYTPVIYEGRDCAVALLDRDARPLGQSTGVPLFLCNLEVCVEYTIGRFGLDWFAPGDVIVMNDPYIQGTHLHDVTVFSPIFYDGGLVGFAATRAHWQDVGGKDPGTTMLSIDVFQEGFRMGPTKVVARFEPVPEWIDFLRRGSRLGYELIGDFNAQVAACRTGEERVRKMLDRVGLDVFLSAKENIFAQSEAIHRAAVAAIPDGTFRASGRLDNDGVSDVPVDIAVTVTVSGDSIHVDLTGTAPQQEGPINCGVAQTVSAAQLAYKSLVKPDLPVTGGTFAPLSVSVPDDCFLNAKEPAACEWYFSGLGVLVSLIITALGGAMGEDAVAADYGDSMVISLSGDTHAGHRKLWVSSEPTAGGWGGHHRGDGEDALINMNNGSFKNIPVEIFESKYPVRIEEFSIRPDTGGAGRHRGGCGVTRAYRLLEPAYLSLWFERSVTPAWGIDGGKAGAGPDCRVSGPDGEWSGLKVNRLPLPPGTVVRVQTGGGGGCGDPFERDPAAVARDVRSGLVSVEAARDAYGAVVSGDFRVDTDGTSRLRQARAVS
jgi:N-methylhydantoinase B